MARQQGNNALHRRFIGRFARNGTHPAASKRNTRSHRGHHRRLQGHRPGHGRGIRPQGSRLILVARDAQAIEAVAQDCRDLGAEALAIAADVTDAMAIAEVAQQAAD